MSGARTEKPTPKRLREARLRGDVATSRELTSAAALAAGAGAAALGGPSACAELAGYLRESLAGATSGAVPPRAALLAAAIQLAAAAAVPLLAAAAGALACGALQTRGLFSLRAAAPRWARVDPAAGLRRLASAAQLSATALGLSKVLAIAALAWTQREALVTGAVALARASSPAAILEGAGAVAPFGARLCVLLAAFGAADLLLARRRHERSLRMTLDEVRREQKDEEGDPQHKAQRRSAHRAIANAPAAARATCVVVNPTRIAVALYHDVDAESAPVVVAKGSGAGARRIRREALRNAVPIVQDVPLARALFRLAEVGDEIPEELYQATAAVLVHVHGLARERHP